MSGDWQHDSFVYAVGSTLADSIWQITLIWLAHCAIQRLTKHSTPSIRYMEAAGFLMFCTAVPLFTFAAISSGFWSISTAGNASIILPSGLYDLPDPLSPSWWAPWIRELGFLMPFLAATWLLGMAVQLAIAVRGVRQLSHLRATARGIDPPASWPRLLGRIVPNVRVALSESSQVTVAATFGWIRPVVLIPLGLLSALSPGEVENILAHELAHIRRRDFAVNVLQAAAESVLFYHPCVWLISRDVCLVREECCDEIAIAATGGNPRAFAQSLLAADGFVPELVMGLTGGSMVNRIDRLVAQQRQPASNAYARCLSATLTSLVLLAFLCNIAAARLGSDSELVHIDKQTLGTSVYELIGVPRSGNPQFAPMIARAVESLKAKPLDRERIIQCVDVIDSGAAPNALLNETPLKPSQWIKLAVAISDQAKRESLPANQSRLFRAAILLAAQDSNRAGAGTLQRLATDPDLIRMGLLPTQTAKRLQMLIAIAAQRDIRIVTLYRQWNKDGGQPPAELQTFMKSIPFATDLVNHRAGIKLVNE